MIPIPTAEVAEILGLSTAAVWKMVARGTLKPIRPGAKPLMFDEDEILEFRYRRRPEAQRELIRRAADQLLAPV